MFIFALWVMIPLLTPTCNAVTTTVTVTSPVNPVKSNAVLSILCYVRNIKKNHMVAITRHDKAGNIKSLSWGKGGVLGDVDDRIFLAVRRDQTDGSEVYLLSIKDVVTEDAGKYSCQVLYNEPGNFTEVAVGTVEVEVYHFPSSDIYPICSPKHLRVKAGDRITLNCASRSGFPTVDMSWSRTDGRPIPDSIRLAENDMVFSNLSFVVSANDQGAIFECKITSNIFPDINKQSCHAGPLIVDGDWVPITLEAKTDNLLDSATLDSDIDTPYSTRQVKPKLSGKCPNCSYSSTLFYWIVATAAASIFAVIFLIWDMILCVKVRRLNHEFQGQKIYQPPPPEDIYLEISNQGRLTVGEPPRRLYMTLEKPHSKREYEERTLCSTGL